MPKSAMVNLANAAIVAAHPDDELLWFAGALNRVGQTIVCYGDDPLVPGRGRRRRTLLATYPLPTLTFLDIEEPRGARNSFLEEGTSSLAALLQKSLRPGIEAVMTHNPWGEYGHEDHVRVSAVVNSLAQSRAIPVYISTYASLRTLPRCRDILQAGVSGILELPIDHNLVDVIRAHYLKHASWTWRKNWQWPDKDVFLRLHGDPPITDASYPLCIIPPRAQS